MVVAVPSVAVRTSCVPGNGPAAINPRELVEALYEVVERVPLVATNVLMNQDYERLGCLPKPCYRREGLADLGRVTHEWLDEPGPLERLPHDLVEVGLVDERRDTEQ